MNDFFHVLMRSIFERLAEHERRLAGTEWRGKIKEVDAEERKAVRIILGKDSDGTDVLSPWVPYKQTAGAVKFHNPPSVGQTMVIRSESGDIEQGLAEPYRWSNENEDISDKEDEHIVQFGDVTVTMVEGGLEAKVGETVLSLTGGEISLKSDSIKSDADQITANADQITSNADAFQVSGNSLKHNSKEVGDTHKHGEVMKGGDETGEPV